MEAPLPRLVLNGWKLQTAVTITLVGLTVTSNVAGLEQLSRLLLYVVGGLHLLAVISFVTERKWYFVFLAVIGWFASILLGLYAADACGLPIHSMLR